MTESDDELGQFQTEVNRKINKIHDRLDYLEKLTGASDAKIRDLQAQAADRGSSGGLNDQRADYLELLIEQWAEKHGAALEEAKGSLLLQVNATKSASTEQGERLKGLEKFAEAFYTNVSAEKIAREQFGARVEQRLEALEGKGEVASCVEISGLSGQASDERLDDLEERLKEIQGSLDAITRRSAAATPQLSMGSVDLDARFAQLEQQIRESAERSERRTKGLEQGQLQILRSDIEVCSQHGEAILKRIKNVELESSECMRSNSAMMRRLEAIEQDGREGVRRCRKDLRCVPPELQDGNSSPRSIEPSSPKYWPSSPKTRMRELPSKLAKTLQSVDVDQRVDFIEKQIIDVAERHARNLESLETGQKKMRGTVDDLLAQVKCDRDARESHIQGVGERLDSLEQSAAESAERHEKHFKELEGASAKLRELARERSSSTSTIALLQERLELLEKQSGNSVEGQARALDALEAKQKKMRTTLEEVQLSLKGEKEVRDSNQTSMMERLEYLERFVGESSDKHEKHFKDLETAHNRLKEVQTLTASEKVTRDQHKTAMEERIFLIERQMGEASENHSKALESLEANLRKLRCGLDELQSSFKGEKETRDSHHSTVGDRLDYLEKFVSESSDKHDKHSKDLETMHGRLKEINGQMGGERLAREQHNAAVDGRLDTVEKRLSDSAEGLSKALETLDANQKKLRTSLNDIHSQVKSEKDAHDRGHATVQERIDYLEKLIGESGDKHSKALGDAKARLLDAHGQIQATKAAHNEHRITVDERLEKLEQQIIDNAKKHIKELDAAHSKLREVQGHFQNEKNSQERHRTGTGEKFDTLERQIGDVADRHSRALDVLEGNHKKLSISLEEVHGNLKGEREQRDSHKGHLEERLRNLEKLITESTSKHDRHLKDLEDAHTKLKDLETAHTKLKDFHGHVAGERAAREQHSASTTQRLDSFERQLETETKNQANVLDSMEGAQKKIRISLEEFQGQLKELRGEGELREARNDILGERVEALEKFVGDTVDKCERQAKALDAVDTNLRDMKTSIARETSARELLNSDIGRRLTQIQENAGSCSAKASIEELQGQVFMLLGNRTTSDKRVEALERMSKEAADNYTRCGLDMDAANARLEEFQGQAAMERVSAEQRRVAIEERLDLVEKRSGDAVDTCAKTVQAMDSRHKALDTATGELQGYLQQVQMLEKQAIETKEKFSKYDRVMEEARSMVDNFHGKVSGEKVARDQTDATLQDRFAILEEQVIKESKAFSALEMNHKSLVNRIEELSGTAGGQEDQRSVGERLAESNAQHMANIKEVTTAMKTLGERVQHLSMVEARMELLERQHRDFSMSQAAGLDDVRSRHLSLQKAMEDLHAGALDNKEALDGHHVALGHRLEKLEAREVQQSGMVPADTLRNVLEETRRERSASASLEERLDALERSITEHSDRHSEMFQSLHEFREHIGDPSILAKAEHLRSVHQVLKAEQAAREAHEEAVHRLVQGEVKIVESLEASFKQHLTMEKETREAQYCHIRGQIEQEQKEREAHHETMMKWMDHEKTSREQAQQSLQDYLLNEKSSRESLIAVLQKQIEQEKAERERHQNNLDDILAQDKADNSKVQEGMYDRVESLERTVGFFDELVRKERDDRVRETKRIWDAIDSHTHDLSTTIVKTALDGSTRGEEVHEVLHDPPRSSPCLSDDAMRQVTAMQQQSQQSPHNHSQTPSAGGGTYIQYGVPSHTLPPTTMRSVSTFPPAQPVSVPPSSCGQRTVVVSPFRGNSQQYSSTSLQVPTSGMVKGASPREIPLETVALGGSTRISAGHVKTVSPREPHMRDSMGLVGRSHAQAGLHSKRRSQRDSTGKPVSAGNSAFRSSSCGWKN